MLLLSLAGTDSRSEIFFPSYETAKGQGEDEKPRVLLDVMLCASIYLSHSVADHSSLLLVKFL